jgi:hypothetical protein
MSFFESLSGLWHAAFCSEMLNKIACNRLFLAVVWDINNCHETTKGGEKMKRIVIMLLPLALLMSLVSGCASRDYVKQQIEPLVDRISKLEARMNDLEAKCGSSADLSGVKQEAADAKTLAEEALKNSKECCANSEEAAKRAEAAAERAEAAAKKAEKAFELHQMK